MLPGHGLAAVYSCRRRVDRRRERSSDGVGEAEREGHAVVSVVGAHGHLHDSRAAGLRSGCCVESDDRWNISSESTELFDGNIRVVKVVDKVMNE